MPITQGRVGGGTGSVSLGAPSGGWTPLMSVGQVGLPASGLATGATAVPNGRGFRSPSFNAVGKFITGVTRDSGGSPLGSCVVELFLTKDDQRVDTTTSDGSGNFTFGATAGPYYLVAYKQGSPDVAGTTVNTLTGA